jgi:hypothetical protein
MAKATALEGRGRTARGSGKRTTSSIRPVASFYYPGVQALAARLGAEFTLDPTITPKMDGDTSVLALRIPANSGAWRRPVSALSS